MVFFFPQHVVISTKHRIEIGAASGWLLLEVYEHLFLIMMRWYHDLVTVDGGKERA